MMDTTKLAQKFASGRKLTASQVSFLQETGHLKKDEYGSLTLTTKALKELNQ